MMSWGDLLVEKDVPPIWEERIILRQLGGRVDLWIFAQAWRTRRMDVTFTAMFPELWETQQEIFEALAVEVGAALDWSLNVRVESKVDYPTGPTSSCVRKLILQVGEGHQLEGPINLLVRFKERWEA